MKKALLFTSLVFVLGWSFSLKAQVMAPCEKTLVTGFCLATESGVSLSTQEESYLKGKFSLISDRYPSLMERVKRNGYSRVEVRGEMKGETGGEVLAEVKKEEKKIIIYRGFFVIEERNSLIKSLGFSMTSIVLLHELLHAYDENDDIVRNNLRVIGWDVAQRVPVNGFRIQEIPQVANFWIPNSKVSQIKNELGPLLSQLGHWEIYLRARNEVKAHGYPSIYSILGGPLESFAELGAYITFDPEASSYVPSSTVQWFRNEVLK